MPVTPRETVEDWADSDNLTLQTSSAPRAGDLLVLVRASSGGDGASLDEPVSSHDWDAGDADGNSSGQPHIAVYTAPVTSNGVQTVQLPFSDSAVQFAVMYVMTGHQSVRAVVATGSTSGSGSHVAPSASGQAGGLLVSAWVGGGDQADGVPVSYTSTPSGMQAREVVQGSSGSRWAAIVSAQQDLGATGVTGTRTATFTRSAPYAAVSITLDAAPSVNVRRFDGFSWIRTAAGDAASVPTGALTLACIARLDANSSWQTLLSLDSSAPNPQAGVQVSPADSVHYVSQSNFPNTLVTLEPSDGWVLIVVTKAAGNATPRGHKYVYDTETWTHQNASGTAGNASNISTGSVLLGDMADFSERWNGRIALAGVWNRALSDVEIEGLTDTLAAWVAAGPAALWPLNQASTSVAVTDVTGGGANQTAISGTVVVADTDLANWFTFEQVSGSVAATLPPLVGSAAADLTVTGAVTGALPLLVGQITGGSLTEAAMQANLPPLVGQVQVMAAAAGSIAGGLPPLAGSVSATVTNPQLVGIRVSAITGPAGPEQRSRVTGPEV